MSEDVSLGDSKWRCHASFSDRWWQLTPSADFAARLRASLGMRATAAGTAPTTVLGCSETHRVGSWVTTLSVTSTFGMCCHPRTSATCQCFLRMPNALCHASRVTLRASASRAFSLFASEAIALWQSGPHVVSATTVGRMGYLSVDAHLDTAPDWNGEIYMSGCPTFRAAEIPNVNPKNVVVFGVYGWLNPREQVEAARGRGISWYRMSDDQVG